MTSEIRDSLRSRGILVPGDNPRSLLPQDWGSKPQRRPKRALINTRRTDLRWPVGRNGKREVPYQITRSNCKRIQCFLNCFWICILWKEKRKACTDSANRQRTSIIRQKQVFCVSFCSIHIENNEQSVTDGRRKGILWSFALGILFKSKLSLF